MWRTTICLAGSIGSSARPEPLGDDRLSRLRAALIDPLRHVYGVADKVLARALSIALLSAPERPLWSETGASMIAIDTLVHQFMHRTGILRRFSAHHAYGAACYRTGGCADILQDVAALIDARQFNPSYPRVFPRFVQHAIWRFCAQQELDRYNGNHIDDRKRCADVACPMFGQCERVCLQE